MLQTSGLPNTRPTHYKAFVDDAATIYFKRLFHSSIILFENVFILQSFVAFPFIIRYECPLAVDDGVVKKSSLFFPHFSGEELICEYHVTSSSGVLQGWKLDVT